MADASDWPRLRHHIEAALATSPGLESIEDVERLIGQGRYQFWAGRQSAAVTEIARFSRCKVLIVVHGGGDLAELLDELEPRMCAFAQAQGCDAIMGTGRKGWERAVAKRGYDFAWINMIKALPGTASHPD